MRDDADRPRSLDTAIVPYVQPADSDRRGPLQVDLVAAVHIGSADYYDRLDEAFAGYDAVLYELVAPPQARVPQPGKPPAGAIGSAQLGMTRLLGLEFQLDKIDYQAGNFVHADLSPREFQAAMEKRSETFWTMFNRLMKEAAAREARGEKPAGGDVGIGDVMGMLFASAPARQVRLRRLMAEQFTNMDLMTETLGGEEGSAIITDRNKAALAVLRKEIAKGRRRIAIFYGAAHMDDFDRRLQEDFALQPRPRETVWLEAWGLRDPEPSGKKPAPAAAGRE
ncbi:MAG: hypothetical protein ACK6CT_15580 [Planctomycetia bacterium]